MSWLDEHGQAYEVPDQILEHLQNLIDEARDDCHLRASVGSVDA